MGMTENVRILALRLLDRFDEHISAQLLLLHYNKHGDQVTSLVGDMGPMRFAGLHGAAFLGIVGIVAAVLEVKEWDVNATDCTGSTALAWAARKGREEVVKSPLERDGGNPDHADIKSGRIPLPWAAENGHEGVVKILLEREDVKPRPAETEYDQTALLRVAMNGHEGVVKLLLEREEVNPDYRDS